MKSFFALMAIGLFLSIATNVFAQADVGDKVCRDVQLAAQAAAGEESDWRNHGGRVGAASDLVKPNVIAEIITPECSSCIMHQFARRTDIADQEPCGPDRICGDGEIDPGEECDDGNIDPGDGCNEFCELEQPDPAPECAPATCGNFIPCNDNGSCGDPVCISSTEGTGFCIEGATPCAGLANCDSSADCAAGEVCATQTCCGVNVCAPVDAFCGAPVTASAEAAATAVIEGPTIGNP